MTLIVNKDIKKIEIIIDNAASDQELTFHLGQDADLAILNIEEIKTEETL